MLDECVPTPIAVKHIHGAVNPEDVCTKSIDVSVVSFILANYMYALGRHVDTLTSSRVHDDGDPSSDSDSEHGVWLSSAVPTSVPRPPVVACPIASDVHIVQPLPTHVSNSVPRVSAVPVQPAYTLRDRPPYPAG